MRIFLLLLLALPALAADFEPSSPEWNGLTRLQEVAGQADLQIQTRDKLDWTQVDERDVLLVIAPQVPPLGPALESLQRFVEAGGRLIVADDFAQGAAWLQPFGLVLKPQPGRMLVHYEALDGLPLATINPDAESVRLAERWQTRQAKVSLAGFLSHELQKPIVLNHPASIQLGAETSALMPGDSIPGNPVAWGRFDQPGLAWLAETDRGAGRVLALADPSVWLNAMLERFHENKQFAANVLRYYCVADRPCKVTLLANLTAVTGIFTPRHPPERAGLRAGLEQLADVLRHLATLLSGKLVAPALILLVLLLIGLPVLLRARTPLPILPPESAPLRQRTALADTVMAWLQNSSADYRRPARLLAAHLTRRLKQLGAGENHGKHQGLPGDPVATMIRSGRVHPQAGVRLRTVLEGVQAETEAHGQQSGDLPLSRARFGQLAADVEWAESLLKHTDGAVEREQ